MKLSRREFVFGIGAAAVAGPGLAMRAPDKPANKPNVLFIAIDDLNDWVGCLGGHPDTLTPNIDRLGARGTVFTNAECAAPACIPSRTAMFTGKSPASTGYYSNNAGYYRNDPKMRDAVTLAEYFSRNGYHTMGAGKITHHIDKKAWDECWAKPYWNNPAPDWYKETNKDRTREWVPVNASREEMTDWKFAEWAEENLKRKHDKPFFLACGFFRPHEPWFAPKEYYDRFPPGKITLPSVNRNDFDDIDKKDLGRNRTALKCLADEGLWRKAVQAYLACINFADECVGKVLDALDASPHRDNTVVVLWSDHGFHLGEKLQWSKFQLWEESARCVLICRVPGVTRPASRCEQPVNLIDLYPTLIDVCGLPKREGLDGRSFLPQLRDATTKRPNPSITANDKGFSLRSERYRYIQYRDGTEELYDHRKDPLEWSNLARNPKYAGVKAELKEYVPTNRAPDMDKRKKEAKART